MYCLWDAQRPIVRPSPLASPKMRFRPPKMTHFPHPSFHGAMTLVFLYSLAVISFPGPDFLQAYRSITGFRVTKAKKRTPQFLCWRVEIVFAATNSALRQRSFNIFWRKFCPPKYEKVSVDPELLMGAFFPFSVLGLRACVPRNRPYGRLGPLHTHTSTFFPLADERGFFCAYVRACVRRGN